MSVISELESGLQAMLALKPPGVSGSKINAITTLCVANVQSESVIVQKFFTHFKKSPGTHKLGVLYVVDSVTRKWMDQAKQHGQTVNSSAPDGTYAAGVYRVTELMPVLMSDIIQNAPADQKDKIKKLVDIWEKGQTFPLATIEGFKSKLNNQSFTPPGSPPPAVVASNGMPAAAKPVVPANILDALANIAKQNASNPQSRPVPAQSTPQPPASSHAAPPAPNAAAALLPFLQAPQAAVPSVTSSAPPFSASQPPTLPQMPALPGFSVPGVPPPGMPAPPTMPPAAAGGDANAAMQLQLLQTLLAQGVPIDKITAIISSLGTNTASAAPPSIPPPGQTAFPPPPPAGWQPPNTSNHNNNNNNNAYDNTRSPQRNRGRSRSRSPRRWDDRRNNDYGRNSPRRDDYRQRSPPRNGNVNGNNDSHRSPPPQTSKWTDFDSTLPSGSIKVLSRTLFVGGVTSSESELRAIFSRYGGVQTCIVNKDKRHAFVKMYTRAEAVAAKDGMEANRTSHGGDMRTRWGVGFGPRDCSDYQTGVSVIPIQKLTDADRKWMLTAPWGGSGGKEIRGGLVVEEPDIEIGAGVSSKAISRRMQTDKGGSFGPRSGDERHGGGGNSNSGSSGGGNNAAMPAFPLGIQMGPNGMPIFPPGFVFPGMPNMLNNSQS